MKTLLLSIRVRMVWQKADVWRQRSRDLDSRSGDSILWREQFSVELKRVFDSVLFEGCKSVSFLPSRQSKWFVHISVNGRKALISNCQLSVCFLHSQCHISNLLQLSFLFFFSMRGNYVTSWNQSQTTCILSTELLSSFPAVYLWLLLHILSLDIRVKSLSLSLSFSLAIWRHGLPWGWIN